MEENTEEVYADHFQSPSSYITEQKILDPSRSEAASYSDQRNTYDEEDTRLDHSALDELNHHRNQTSLNTIATDDFL